MSCTGTIMLSLYIYCNIFDFGRRVGSFSPGERVSQVRDCPLTEINTVKCDNPNPNCTSNMLVVGFGGGKQNKYRI